MTLKNSSYYIGVDGGGSKTHAVLVNTDGAIIQEAYAGAANIRNDVELAYNSIFQVITELVKAHNLNPQEIKIGIGVAGFSMKSEREYLLRKLHQHFLHIKIESDCHIACLAAHNGMSGSVVICGTGVVAYTIDNERRNMQQLGGWGFPHGDFGSGAWFGMHLANRVCSAIDGVIPWTSSLELIYARFGQDNLSYKMWLVNAKASDFAELAKMILTTTNNNTGATVDFISQDENVNSLIEEGSQYISQLLNLLTKTYPKLPLKLIGGLAPIYLTRLQQKFPHLTLSANPPALGGYLLFTTAND